MHDCFKKYNDVKGLIAKGDTLPWDESPNVVLSTNI